MLSPELEERLKRLCSSRHRRLLGIAGPPGGGKSTLAAAVASEAPVAAVVVPMDGFHLSNHQLQLLERSNRKGAPDTFDVDGYTSLLRRLRHPEATGTVYAPQFERSIEESIAAVIAVSFDVPLVITEGNYLLSAIGGWHAVRPLLDEVWYIDIDPSLRRERLVERHVRFGRTRAEAEDWVARTDDPNAALIESTRHLADFHVTL